MSGDVVELLRCPARRPGSVAKCGGVLGEVIAGTVVPVEAKRPLPGIPLERCDRCGRKWLLTASGEGFDP